MAASVGRHARAASLLAACLVAAALAWPARAQDQAPLASLTLGHAGNDRRVALVRNLAAGPVEIQLELPEASNIATIPEFPLRLVLAAGEERPVATLAQRSHHAGQFSLRMATVPGPPGAVHTDPPYRFPLPADADWTLAQGFHGPFSHDDPQNRYALDLAVAEGTPVLAARAGTVFAVETGFTEGGLDRARHLGRANYVRILHEDGSMAVYAHLQPVTAVLPGERVEAGQVIGYSGNTGFSAGPHLHLAIQVNAGLRLESVPFQLLGPDGRRLPAQP